MKLEVLGNVNKPARIEIYAGLQIARENVYETPNYCVNKIVAK
jgi:hypothetical protein